jgi:hypothetical protein
MSILWGAATTTERVLLTLLPPIASTSKEAMPSATATVEIHQAVAISAILTRGLSAQSLKVEISIQ